MAKVCFLIDCTISMEPYWRSVREEIADIILNGKEDTDYALVGYRDIGDQTPLIVVDFGTTRDTVLNRVYGIRPKGGVDTAEDVAGGLREVTELDWDDSTMRTVVHFADAPAHGNMYHHGDIEDRFPDGDPRGLNPLKYITYLAKMNVNYDFYRLNDSTDLMVERFQEVYRDELASFCVIGKLDTSETNQEEELYSPKSPVCYCRKD